MEKNRSTSVSFVWKLIERIGTQGILLVISIIVARILSPKEYGILAIQMVFIGLANSLVQNGINIALVQKKEVTKIDYSTAFVLSLLASGIFYFLIYISAPYIATFYSMPELTLSLRILSMILFVSALLVVQNAYMMRNMLFKELAICSFISSLISGAIGIGAAYMGFGLWALVLQQLSGNTLQSLLLILVTRWKPSILYSRASADSLLKFGLPVAGSYLIDTLYGDLRSLIIGKLFSSSQLGIFERAKQFPRIITSNISNTIQSVILPVFARNKENQKMITQQLAKAIQMIYIIVLPAMIFMCVTAKPLIVVLLTDKWIECVPLLIASCLMCIFWPLHAINTQTFVALGYSKQRLYTEIIVKVVDVLTLLISVVFFRNILAIAIGATLASFLSTIVYSYPCYRILSFGFIQQLKVLFPYIVYTCISSVSMYLVGVIFSDSSSFVVLISELLTGSLIYLSLVYKFSRHALISILSTFKRK